MKNFCISVVKKDWFLNDYHITRDLISEKLTVYGLYRSFILFIFYVCKIRPRGKISVSKLYPVHSFKSLKFIIIIVIISCFFEQPGA
jgi:hypothetical protein